MGPWGKKHGLINELAYSKAQVCHKKKGGLFIKILIWALYGNNKQDRESEEKKKPTSTSKDTVCGVLFL